MKRKKSLLLLAFAILVFGSVPAYAMHIMEGFLPVGHAIAYTVLMIPFLILGYRSIRKTIDDHPENKMLLALAGAFVFLLSSLKLPAMTGSCSHPTGTGLGVVLFGPGPLFVIGPIVLLFQALLLAHGGLTTLGANSFSMGVVGPVVGWLVFKLMRKTNANEYLAVFLASTMACLSTYVLTSIQLGLAFPEGSLIIAIGKYLSIFAITQIPIAIIEGLLTVLIYNGIKSYEGGRLLYENF